MTAGSWTQKDSAPCLCIPKLARENTTFGNCQHRTSPKLLQSQIPNQTSPLPAWCCFCFLSAACKCVLLRFVIHMHPHGWRTLLRSVCESVCMIARQQLHGNIITHNQMNPWHLHESSMPYAISIGVSFARFSNKQTSTLQKIRSNFAKKHILWYPAYSQRLKQQTRWWFTIPCSRPLFQPVQKWQSTPNPWGNWTDRSKSYQQIYI